ncbi:MAG: hypothetical protein ACP5MC_01705 [Candidatus Micrarchaeia archaeon]
MKEKKEEKSTKKNVAALAAILVVPSLIVFLVLFLLLRQPGVPFSTFKSNFLSASNVSIVATFSNESEFAAEATCFTYLREVLHFKNMSAVHVFLIDSNNSTCLFSPTISPVRIESKPASYCLGIANSEPSIFLNYSAINASIVTAYKLTIFGNEEYMQRCPVAVDMS